AISLQAAIPVLFGDNLGTTITAILASIGASVAARRAALTHVIFNVIGASIFIVLLQLFIKYVAFLQSSLNLSAEMTLAFANCCYNITNSAIQFLFIGLLEWVVTKAIPGEDLTMEYKPQHLDPLFIKQSSSVDLSQGKADIIRMGGYSVQCLEE